MGRFDVISRFDVIGRFYEIRRSSNFATKDYNHVPIKKTDQKFHPEKGLPIIIELDNNFSQFIRNQLFEAVPVYFLASADVDSYELVVLPENLF